MTKFSGVGAFQLLVSMDNVDYVPVTSGYLQDLRWKACRYQRNSVYSFRPTKARYFKLQVNCNITYSIQTVMDTHQYWI